MEGVNACEVVSLYLELCVWYARQGQQLQVVGAMDGWQVSCLQASLGRNPNVGMPHMHMQEMCYSNSVIQVSNCEWKVQSSSMSVPGVSNAQRAIV